MTRTISLLHTPNTKAIKVGTFKPNRMQVKGALELLRDSVKWFEGVSPREFFVISAYRPNVEYGNMLLKQGFQQQKFMPPIQTTNSSQGREGSISVVITYRYQGRPHPRFHLGLSYQSPSRAVAEPSTMVFESEQHRQQILRKPGRREVPWARGWGL